MTRFDVGIRELGRKPGEIVGRAEAGDTFSVLRNGKRTRVVITSEDRPKARWVPAGLLREALDAVGTDQTGWVDEVNAG
jgi:antitoxin (DNA-binding transcriptional repressor) of toxin-antitoxin stability system